MCMHSGSKPELIARRYFWNNEWIKNEFNDNEKLENHIFKSFFEIIKFVDGNYKVKLPFFPGIIGDNYLLAKNRLKILTEHFYENKDELYENEYQKHKKKLLKDTRKYPSRKCYDLPHPPVSCPEKFTTKIRMVFLASSKLKSVKIFNHKVNIKTTTNEAEWSKTE